MRRNKVLDTLEGDSFMGEARRRFLWKERKKEKKRSKKRLNE